MSGGGDREAIRLTSHHARHRRGVLPVVLLLVVLCALGVPSPSTWGASLNTAGSQLADRNATAGRSSGAAVSGRGYLHTLGARLLDATGHGVRLTGVNWFGLETCSFAPHGLAVRNWRSLLKQVKQLGFNSIRLPFSNQLFDPGSQPNGINYTLNTDLQGLSGLQIMDKVVGEARRLGLKVILDQHRPDCGAQSTLWYTDRYSEARWISDWVMLAKRYARNNAVIGADLHNEPHGSATWGDGNPLTDWRLAAQRAGNAILQANSHWLIIVEGIEHVGPADWYWWGGNLAGAAGAPVQLNVPNRVVYSAHDYGPEIYDQKWFDDPAFPANLPGVWDAHWGYLQKRGTAPVFLGEFGGRQVTAGKEGQWIHSLVRYLHANSISYTFWSLNPDSGDTGGILLDDWKTVDTAKLALLRTDQAPLIRLPRAHHKKHRTARPSSKPRAVPPSPAVRRRPSAVTTPAPTPTRAVPTASAVGPIARGVVVMYSTNRSDIGSNNPSPNLQIVNRGSAPVALSSLEARYYFTAEGLNGQPQLLDVDWASFGAGNVQGSFVPLGGDACYLRLTFSPSAGQIAAEGGTAEVKVRIHKPDWSPYDQANDFGFSPTTTYTAWPHVPLLQNGRLIWGALPAVPALGQQRTSVQTAAPRVEVQYAAGRLDAQSNNPSLNLRIVNDGSAPISLSALEARYYYTAERLNGQQQLLDIDWASIGAGNVLGEFVHADGDLYYLRLRFSTGAGDLAPGSAAEVKVRLHKPDWSPYVQTNDYSFGTPSSYVQWQRIPLFENGRRIWGTVPPSTP